jgi:hypothetical protein
MEDLTIQDKINEFLKANGFPEDGGSSQKIAWFKVIGPIAIPLPNFKTRRDHIYVHDVSHMLTGYDTSWKGEGAVSAWEISSGGWKKFWILWLFTLSGFGVGVLFYFKSTKAAFNKGLHMYNGLTKGWSKEEVLNSKYSEKEQNFQREIPLRMSFSFWATLAALTTLSPLIIAGIIVAFILF